MTDSLGRLIEEFQDGRREKDERKLTHIREILLSMGWKVEERGSFLELKYMPEKGEETE